MALLEGALTAQVINLKSDFFKEAAKCLKSLVSIFQFRYGLLWIFDVIFLVTVYFSGFLQFPGHFALGQNNSKYRDWAKVSANGHVAKDIF